MCVGPPYDGSLELRLGVMHDVLQDPPQRNWDGQKDKNSGDEPSFTVSPDLQNQSKNPHEPLFWSGHGNRQVLGGSVPCLSGAPRYRGAALQPGGDSKEPEPAGGSTFSTLPMNMA